MKVKCPICACEIKETPVTCDRCGVEYHLDCWNYNEGCAIYGCRPPVASTTGSGLSIMDRSDLSTKGKSTLPVKGKVIVPETVAPSSFLLRNAVVFATAIIPPSGFIVYDKPLYRILLLSSLKPRLTLPIQI